MRYIYFSAALLLFFGTALVGCNKPAETVTDPMETTAVVFANTKCPIMGGKPSEKLTVEYQGKTIGFCCDGCPEKWAALSDTEKADRFAKAK